MFENYHLEKKGSYQLIIFMLVLLTLTSVFFVYSYDLFALPTHLTPILNTTDGTNRTNQNLTLYNVSTADADNDAVKNIITWEIDTEPYTILAMPFEGGSQNGSIAGVSNGVRDYALGNNGTVTNATWNRTGGYDGFGCYDFTFNDYINLGQTPSVALYNNFSVSVWVKTNDSQGQAILSRSSRFAMLVNLDGALRIYAKNSTGSAAEVLTLGNVRDRKWHHIAVTYDGYIWKAYIDGLTSTTTSSVISGNLSADAIDTFVGFYAAAAPDDYFNGSIDDLYLFNRTLSEEQILALYNNRTNLIVSQETAAGETWSANLTPNDGTGDGVTLPSNEISLVVSNLPTQGNPILNASSSSNLTKDNLTAWNISTNDVDGDGVKNIYNWYQNGNSFMVLNMPFEGGSQNGTTSGVANGVKDYSAYANNGTVVNVTWDGAGGYDLKGAYLFEGNNSPGYIQIEPSSSLSFGSSQDATIVLRLRTEHSAFDVISQATAGAPLWRLQVLAAGTMRILLNDGVNSASSISTTAINDNAWHMVVATLDRDQNSKIYIDGVLEDTDDISSVGNITSTGGTFIGKFGTSSTSYFNGSIDEIMIFDRVLSAEQILALYNNETNKIVSQETSSNDIWTVQIYPNDGTGDGLAKNSSITVVSNHLPTQNNPILNSTTNYNQTHDNLTAYNISTIDIDGNPIKNIYNWYKNDESYLILNMPFEGGSQNGTGSGVAQGVKDYSAYANNGTVYNAVWNSTGGYDGLGCYEFNGTNTYISLGSDSIFNLTKSMTVILWVRNALFNNSLKSDFVITKGTTYYGSTFGIWRLTSDGAFSATLSTLGTSTNFSVLNYDSISDNGWHQLAFSFNTDNLNFSIYQDGLPVGSTLTSSETLFGNTNNLYLGGGVLDRYFNGSIDDVMIFNSTLSAEQILAIYENKTNMIVSQETVAGDSWTVQIYPNDGIGDGLAKNSSITLLDPLTTVDYSVVTQPNATTSSRNWLFINITSPLRFPSNLTFYLYNSSNVIINTSNFSMSSSTDNTYYNFTNLDNATYYYKVTIRDAAGNTNSTTQRVIFLDMIGPNVTLTTPASYSQDYDNTVTFGYKVNDSLNQISNCTLFINYTSNITNTSITQNIDQNFTVRQIPEWDNLSWYVTCYDNASNAGNSSVWFLDAKKDSTTSSSSTSSSSSGGSSSGSGISTASSSVAYISDLTPDEPQTVIFNKAQHSIREIELNVISTVENVKLSVQDLTFAPSDIEELENVYQYMNIQASNLNEINLDSAEIKFRVEKSWLEENNFNKNNINLYRYYISKWKKLDTDYKIEDDSYYYYEAETPGFSTFAIVYLEEELVEEQVIEDQEETVTEEQPLTFELDLKQISYWWYIGAGIGCILITGLILFLVFRPRELPKPEKKIKPKKRTKKIIRK